MAITRVQKKQCYIANNGALNSSQTAGNLIIITVQGYSYNGTPATITCTSSGSDTPIKATQALGPNYGAGLILWYIWNCETGTPTYTVGGTPDDCSLTIYEYAGADASADPLIDADSITNSSANPLGVTLTTEAGGLLFFTWGDEVNLSFSSMNTGATLITFDTSRYTADAENLNTSASSTTVNANVSSDVDSMIVAASFRIAGGGGPTNYTLSASKGAFSETGKASSLLAGRILSSSKGSYTETGKAASLLSGRKILSSKGLISDTGKPVNLFAGRKISLSKGLFTLTGKDATITKTGSYVLSASKGSYLLSGKTTELKATHKLSASKGLFAQAGRDVSLIIGKYLSISKGSFLFTGSNVAFARTYKLSASGGSYSFTGKVASLIYSGAPQWNGSVIEASTIGPSAINGQNGDNNNSVIQQQGTGNSVIT